jgi:hypothetical protein
MKTWKDIKEGDYVYQYIKLKMVPRLVTKVEYKEVTVEKEINPRKKEIEIKIFIEITLDGKTTWQVRESRMNDYVDKIPWGWDTVYADIEAAHDYVKERIEYREKKAERLKANYEKELDFIKRYKDNNKDLFTELADNCI